MAVYVVSLNIVFSVYAPTVNPDLTKSRQQKVISDMIEYGYLSQEEADKLK